MGLISTRTALLRESQDLLPPGDIWKGRVRTLLGRLLFALTRGPAEAEERAKDLLLEADPRTASELLDEWERVLGLPDDCLPAPQSEAERRALIVSRAIGPGGNTPRFFIDLAAAIGIPITVEEGRATPARVGQARIGDRLLGELPDLVWTVFAPNTPESRARVGTARIGDRLSTSGNDLLECVLSRHVPAHTLLQFRYVEGALFLRVALPGGGFATVRIQGNVLPVRIPGGTAGIPIQSGSVSVGIPGGSAAAVPVGPL